MSTTEPLTVSDARSQLAAIIDLARAEHEPIYLTRRGRRVAAVIDAEDLDEILARLLALNLERAKTGGATATPEAEENDDAE